LLRTAQPHNALFIKQAGKRVGQLLIGFDKLMFGFQ